ncbi:hypothetical protein WJX82_010371 [Trebouxia sp. C0006]
MQSIRSVVGSILPSAIDAKVTSWTGLRAVPEPSEASFAATKAQEFFKSRQQMAFLELERFSRTVNGPTFDADYIRAGLERALTSVEGKKVKKRCRGPSSDWHAAIDAVTEGHMQSMLKYRAGVVRKHMAATRRKMADSTQEQERLAVMVEGLQKENRHLQQIQAGAVPAYFPPDLLLELKQQGQGSPGSPQSPLDIAQHATQQDVIHALVTQVCHLQQELGSQIQQAEQRRLPKVEMMNNWQFGAELGAGVHDSIIDLVNPVWPGAVLKQSSPAALQDEAASLELLHHPNIVDLYGTAFVSHHHPPRIEDFLVVRRLGSSLATWNGDYSCMSDREKIVGCLGLVSALLWTHDHGIVHQDLHKSNIVYSVDRSQWVLIDFGNTAWAKTEGKDTVIKGARRSV